MTRRDKRRFMGACLQCGKPSGKFTLCKAHRQAAAAATAKYRSSEKAPTSAERAEFRAKQKREKIARGECLDCPNPSPKFRRCIACRRKEAKRSRKRIR